MEKKIFRNILTKISPMVKHMGQLYFQNKNFSIEPEEHHLIHAAVHEEGTFHVEIDTELQMVRCSCPGYIEKKECAHISAILFALLDHRNVVAPAKKDVPKSDWKSEFKRELKDLKLIESQQQPFKYVFDAQFVGEMILIEFTKYFIKQDNTLGRELKISKDDPFDSVNANSFEEQDFLQALFLYAYQIDHFTYPKNKIRMKPIAFANKLLDILPQVKMNWKSTKLTVYPEPVVVQPVYENETYQLKILPEISEPFFTDRLTPLAEFPLSFTDGSWIFRTKMMNSADSFKMMKRLIEKTERVPKADKEELESSFLAPVLAKFKLPFPTDWLPNEICVDPIPELRLVETENQLLIEIYMGYESFKYPFFEQTETHIETTPKAVKVFRNLEKEAQWLTELREGYFLKLFQKQYFLPSIDFIEWVYEQIPRLADRGITVLGENLLRKYRVNRESGTLNVAFNSIKDWLTMSGSVQVGEEQIDLRVLMRENLRQKKFIKLTSGNFRLKEEWIEQLSLLQGIAEVDEEIKIHQFHYSALDELFQAADFSQIEREVRKKIFGFQSSEIRKIQTPKALQATLRDYQRDGFSWLNHLHKHRLGGLLADDMGLGKTVQMIALISKLYSKKQTKPSLIVVPTSLVYNWCDELERFNPNLTFHVLEGKDRETIFQETKSQLYIVTYGLVIRDIEWLKEVEFECIILDESQQIKNPITKSYRAARLLKSAQRYALTGTPVENNLMDLWAQFSFINPGLLGNQSFFKDSFAREIATGMNPKRADLLRKMIHPFLLRRTKEAVLTELPGKTETIIKCEMTPEQESLYIRTRDTYLALFENQLKNTGIAKTRFKALEAMIKLRQICNHPKTVDSQFSASSGKLNIILEMLEEILEENHNVLIFSQFVKMLSIFRDELKKRGISYSYLDGSTRNRRDAISDFKESEKQVFLISLKAGGVGLNLTKADYVFLVDPWWNPAVEAQAVERVYRIGQENPVFVYRFITEMSIEEKVRELQQKKKLLVDQVITEDQSILKQLDEDALLYLFK